MQANALQISDNFRKMAFRSVFSIVLFVFTYLVLIALGIGVILLCGLIAYFLVVSKAMFLTLMLALGFIGMGFLIFFFLIKFIFSKPNKIDRSHLLEITEQQQPELFQLIREIVNEVQTNFPKKVYLSSDVNASVFYDSNFWSMFFPVKKNLQIGLGLMNSISAIELKAILAHEFGHFSQRSMKVGSYVHHVNKVIYNMLYDNEGYSNLIGRWSGASSYFILFAKGSILVVQGIQYVLVKVHAVLNLNYMALSREMEFHADAVAANVAGSQPLVNSLLRLELADQSLNVVFNYYNNKIAESQKANNFYPQQYFVLNQIASVEELPIQDGLPTLSIESYKKFNKTKLVLDDQWSSHPSTEQRVAKLNALNLPEKGSHKGIAIDLLADKELLQNLITERLFEGINYETQPILLAPEDFIADYKKREAENAYPLVFKSYFDQRNPYKDFTDADFENPAPNQVLRFEELINAESTAEINSLHTAITDQETIRKINRGEIQVQSFDYDGTKYSTMDAFSLINFLTAEIERLKKILDQRDSDLFKLFLNKAVQQNKVADFKTHALAYQQGTTNTQAQQDAYFNLIDAASFMQTSTPLDQIREQMVQVKKMEEPFKTQLKLILENPGYQDVMDTAMRAGFEEYLDKNWSYFGHDTYFNAEVDAFFGVMTDFTNVVFKHHFHLKKALLQFQETLVA